MGVKYIWEVPERRDSMATWPQHEQHKQGDMIKLDERAQIGQVGQVKTSGFSSKNTGTSKLLKGFKEENCHALICFC